MQSNRLTHILRSIWRWVSSRELLTYMVFVVLATLLWGGHALTSVRNARIPVHITYTGIPENIDFSTPMTDVVYIEVRDAGRRLMDYRTDPPKLNYDISSQLKRDKGQVRISEEVLRRNISDLLQGTSKLQQVTPEQLTGTYYTQHDRSVTVQIAGELSADREYVFVHKPEVATHKVTIYGSKEAIHAIDTIYTETLSEKNLRDTTELKVRLVAPEGIRLATDSVVIRSIAERVTEKVITVPVYPIAVPEDVAIRLFPTEVKATLLVSVAHFAEIDAHAIKARCHYPRQAETELAVNVSYTSPYIYGVRVSPSVLEFIIEEGSGSSK